MYTFIPASSERYDAILMESYSKCSSIFSLYDLNDLFEESGKEEDSSTTNRILESIITFFKKMISVLRDFTKKITSKFSASKDKVSVRAQMALIKKNVNKLKKAGASTVDFYDVKEYDKCMKAFSTRVGAMITKWESRIHEKTSTAGRAEKFVREAEDLIKETNNKLNTIKSKKKPYPIDEVIKWLDAQISGEGVTQVTMSDYISQLEKLTTFTDSVKKQLDKYSEKTGYVPMAKSIKDVTNNITIFLKKNYDWCAAYAATVIIAIHSIATDMVNVQNGIYQTTGGLQKEPDKKAKKAKSAIYRMQQRDISDVGSAYSQASNDEASKKYRSNRAIDAALVTGTLGLGMTLQQKKKTQNSIYDD